MINEHGMTCMRPEHYRLPVACFLFPMCSCIVWRKRNIITL